MQVSRQVAAGAFCALLALSGAYAWAADVYHDNVVIVLDSSGSMGSPMSKTSVRKIMAAKAALKEVLKQVDESTYVGLLVFSAKNLKEDWVYPLGPRDDARLQQAIERPVPGGGTPLGRYMKIAADRLLQERAEQYGYGTYRLLIVTDGQAQDLELVDRYTPEIMARGITIDVIGVDMKGTHTLATKVHSYRRADDPESLKRAIADVFAEVSASSTDAASSEAFDVIAPLPFEVAAGMVKALATSGNEPIGEKKAAPNAGRRQPPGQKSASTARPGAPPPPQQPQRPADARPSSGVPFRLIVLIVIAIVVLSTISRRRRARR